MINWTELAFTWWSIILRYASGTASDTTGTALRDTAKYCKCYYKLLPYITSYDQVLRVLLRDTTRYYEWYYDTLLNGHTMSNRRRFRVDVTSIRQRINFDEFSRHFHVLFRCNFAALKTYLFRRTFLDVILMVKKSTLFACNFFDDFQWAKTRRHLLQANENFENVILC